MQTISQEEFQKKYGAIGMQSFKPVEKKQSSISDAFSSGIQKFKSGAEDVGQSLQTKNVGLGIGQLFAGTFKAGSGLIGAATAPLAPVLKPVGKAIELAGQGYGSIPAVQKFAQTPAGQATSEIAGNVGNIADVAGFAGGLAEGSVVRPKIKGMLERKPEVSTTPAGESVNNYVSRKLYESGIGRTSDEATRILNARADRLLGKEVPEPTTRATTAQKYGLAGRQTNIGIQARVAGKRLFQDKILPALKESKDVITKEDLFKPLQEKIDATVDPSRKIDLQDAFDALKEEYKNESSWSLEKAQELKKGIDKFTQEKVFKGKPIASSYNELRHDIADTIRSHTYEKLKDQNIKQQYLDYGNLKELEKIGVKGITDNQLKGGAGAFLSGVMSKAVTPIATHLGKVLYRVPGTKITFIAEPGIKNLAQHAESQGLDTSFWQAAKENIKNPQNRQGGFIDFGSIAKKIDSTDRNIMQSFLDEFASKKMSAQTAKRAQDLADAMKLKSRFGTNSSIAKEFSQILNLDRSNLKKRFNYKPK